MFEPLRALAYRHVDVFSREPLSGNGLTVFPEAGALTPETMQRITREGRTWDNDGRVEDIATGSAAGPVGAYLVRHGLEAPSTEIALHQGRFLGRPSQMRVWVDAANGDIAAVRVTGDVRMVACGIFD